MLEVWLAMFLGMSITLNILLARAYFNEVKFTNEMRRIHKDFDRLFSSMEKTMTKHKSSFQKGKSK